MIAVYIKRLSRVMAPGIGLIEEALGPHIWVPYSRDGKKEGPRVSDLLQSHTR